MRRRRWLWIGGSIVAAALAAFVLVGSREPPLRAAPETPLLILTLAGGPEQPDSEISGMDWHGDELVLLPQYPRRFGPDGGAVFVAERAAIEHGIDTEGRRAIQVRAIPLEAPGLEEALPGFDGYEAIAFEDQDVYFTIETRTHGDRTVGYLLRGRAHGRPLERIVVDVTARVRLAAQTNLPNTGYEALTVHGDRIVAVYEANGEINPRPRALVFDRALAPRGDLTMPGIEYRVTDATDVDSHGRFWVANYYWPGSRSPPRVCQLTERYGQGESHARCATVERLVELRLVGGRLSPTGRAPVLFELVDDAHARNWEGVVRLPGRGFLVVTDEHPSTIFAFVAAP